MPKEFQSHGFKIRAGERRAAGHAVSIRIPGLGEASGTLRNVSNEGVGLRTSQYLPIGTTVHLCVDEGVELPLRVQWQLGESAGARFAPDACPDALGATLGRFGPVAGEEEA